MTGHTVASARNERAVDSLKFCTVPALSMMVCTALASRLGEMKCNEQPGQRGWHDFLFSGACRPAPRTAVRTPAGFQHTAKPRPPLAHPPAPRLGCARWGSWSPRSRACTRWRRCGQWCADERAKELEEAASELQQPSGAVPTGVNAPSLQATSASLPPPVHLLSALMTILRSVGPVISTRRSCTHNQTAAAKLL